MHVFSVTGEAEFNPKKHVEKILGTIEDGDVTVACWEPGQISPNHCHPHATETISASKAAAPCARRGKPSRWCPAPSWCIRPAKCTNTRTARNARCCSACATAPTWSRASHLARPSGLDAKRRRRRLLQKAPGQRLKRGDRALVICGGLFCMRNRRCRAWRLRIAQTSRRRIPAPIRSSGRNCDARAGPRPANRTTPQPARRQP